MQRGAASIRRRQHRAVAIRRVAPWRSHFAEGLAVVTTVGIGSDCVRHTALEGKERSDCPALEQVAEHAFLVSEIDQSEERLGLPGNTGINKQLVVIVLRPIHRPYVPRVEDGSGTAGL